MAAVESEQDAVTAQTGKNFAEHKDLHSDQGAQPDDQGVGTGLAGVREG